MEEFRVIIAGGREVTGDTADELVSSAIFESGWQDEITEVIHGDAHGIDKAAQRVCQGKWPIVRMPADWDSYGKSAGPRRNREMAERADALIAVWDGMSRGTANMIQTAKQRGLSVFVYRYT